MKILKQKFGYRCLRCYSLTDCRVQLGHRDAPFCPKCAYKIKRTGVGAKFSDPTIRWYTIEELEADDVRVIDDFLWSWFVEEEYVHEINLVDLAIPFT